MKGFKSKRGISLIVLVITIIVMIILAAAIILSISNSGIMDKANKAKNDSDAANAKELVALAYSDWTLDEEKITSEDSTITSFVKYAEKKLKEAGYKVNEGAGSYEVCENGEVYVYPTIPTGFVASDIAGENTVAGGLVIYEGTAAVSTDSDAQTTRNQFVWVPVTNMSDFVLKDWGSATDVANGKVLEPATAEVGYDTGETESYGQPIYAYTTLSASNDLTGEYAEYAAMKASVEKYGGFYIARYEAGKKDSKVVFQKGANVYINVSWGESMIDVGDDSAVALSRSLYADNGSVVSTLCYDVQWDAALTFISKTDKSYPTANDRGVHNIDDAATAGSLDTDKVSNIYDMAGNLYEWVMSQGTSSWQCTGRNVRGGFYYSPGFAGYRMDYYADASENRIGFRTTLYLK